jgi:hypothetical protein
MNPGDKVIHPYWGKCVVVEVGKEQTKVQLANGVHQVVSTDWLKPDVPAFEASAEPKP